MSDKRRKVVLMAFVLTDEAEAVIGDRVLKHTYYQRIALPFVKSEFKDLEPHTAEELAAAIKVEKRVVFNDCVEADVVEGTAEEIAAMLTENLAVAFRHAASAPDGVTGTTVLWGRADVRHLDAKIKSVE